MNRTLWLLAIICSALLGFTSHDYISGRTSARLAGSTAPPSLPVVTLEHSCVGDSSSKWLAAKSGGQITITEYSTYYGCGKETKSEHVFARYKSKDIAQAARCAAAKTAAQRHGVYQERDFEHRDFLVHLHCDPITDGQS